MAGEREAGDKYRQTGCYSACQACPGRLAEQPDADRLRQHLAYDTPLGPADRPQRADLAHALRDRAEGQQHRDRERQPGLGSLTGSVALGHFIASYLRRIFLALVFKSPNSLRLPHAEEKHCGHEGNDTGSDVH